MVKSVYIFMNTRAIQVHMQYVHTYVYIHTFMDKSLETDR